MICLVLPLLIGFGIDCVLGDPHSLPHPVVLIGKTISALECVLRRIFPKTPRGERRVILRIGSLPGCQDECDILRHNRVKLSTKVNKKAL